MKTQKPKTRQQWRVAIMRDVIAQTLAQAFIPESGVYAALADNSDGRPIVINQTTLNKVRRPPCRVCELGAMFLSAVRLGNKFEGVVGGWQSVTSYKMRIRLAEFFDYEELTTLEALFEGWVDLSDVRATAESELRSRFSRTFSNLSDRNRMLFICREVVRQKGAVDINQLLAAAVKWAAAKIK